MLLSLLVAPVLAMKFIEGQGNVVPADLEAPLEEKGENCLALLCILKLIVFFCGATRGAGAGAYFPSFI